MPKARLGERKIVASLWMSLDGVMESPEKWAFTYSDAEVEEVNSARMADSDAMLLGRVTYEEFAAFWPRQSSADGPIADYINRTKKFVISRTLKTVEWQNSELIKGDLKDGIRRLKQRSGKNITVVGSATLTRWLLDNGLLDELRLMIPPVVVGTGRKLFENESDARALRLSDSASFKSGVLSLVYKPLEHDSVKTASDTRASNASAQPAARAAISAA